MSTRSRRVFGLAAALVLSICPVARPSNLHRKSFQSIPMRSILLDGSRDVAVSPDGAHVYTSIRDSHSRWGDGVVFSRDPVTDSLTPLGPSGLRDCLRVSPAGAHVYTWGEYYDGGYRYLLQAYGRDTVTGGVSYLSYISWQSNTSGTPTEKSQWTISPDGEHLYVLNGTRQLERFARDEASGALSSLGTTESPVPLSAVSSSPDGEAVWAVGSEIVVFARDPATGDLTVSDRLALSSTRTYRLLASADASHAYAASDSYYAPSGSYEDARIEMIARNAAHARRHRA